MFGKLFQIDLPLQAFVSVPGDLIANLSHDGQYNLLLKLPFGVMHFNGATEKDLQADVLKAMRAMCKQDVVPDIALISVSELLTDLPYNIIRLNDLMKESVEASPEEVLNAAWSSIFTNDTPRFEQYAQQGKAQVENQSELENPFANVRYISLNSLEELPQALAQIFASRQEAEDDSQQPPKRFS